VLRLSDTRRKKSLECSGARDVSSGSRVDCSKGTWVRDDELVEVKVSVGVRPVFDLSMRGIVNGRRGMGAWRSRALQEDPGLIMGSCCVQTGGCIVIAAGARDQTGNYTGNLSGAVFLLFWFLPYRSPTL